MNEGAPENRPTTWPLAGSEDRGALVKVFGVYEHREPAIQSQHFVLLKDDEDRKLPIWIGQFEAWQVSYALEGAKYDRPLTHDLMAILTEAGGLHLEYAFIDNLRDETFYSYLGFRSESGGLVAVDSRPSDAIALALRCKAPIHVAEWVMQAPPPRPMP